MASISFTDEAAEAFSYFLRHLEGWAVEVTPGDSDMKPFTAVVVGSGSEETDDYFGVMLRRWDDATSELTGEPFALVVDDLEVL